MTETAAPVSWIQELRRRLAEPPPRTLPPALPERSPAGVPRRAAVLVPLFVDAGALWTFFVRRSRDLPHHRGQIAFPGGGLEEGEEEWDAALREAREEIALPTETVIRLGTLDELSAPSGFRIVPCVGAVPPFDPEPDRREIEEVFRVPLTAFADPRLVEDRRVRIDDRERLLRVYHVGSRQIWGLTARIVQLLLGRLGLENPQEQG